MAIFRPAAYGCRAICSSNVVLPDPRKPATSTSLILGLHSSYALFWLAGALLFLGELVGLAGVEHGAEVLWLYVGRQVAALTQNEPTVITDLID